VDRADLTPKELADLNDKEALTDYRDKQQELADATIAWRKFQSDPNNPQYQLAKDRLDNARRNTAVAEKRLGVSQQRLDLSEDIFKAGQFGGFAKAQVFLDSVSELADKINTSNGVWAKAKGSEREQAAKLNLDDDVAEYDSLVEAFTPLWARALGHSGVLTQQDVDSARAALPKAGDSKTLKDRKIARIQKIMAGEMKATEAVTGQENPTGPAKAAPTPGATGKTTAPKGVAQEDWNAMTDAERALWPKN
jgi:hypothetical protein